MAETSSPALEGATWAQCTCKTCAARRQQDSPEPGCPCKECQPGSGIDYGAIRHNVTRRRQARMRVLLQRDPLTPAEERELDDLLHIYLYSN